MQLAPVQGKDLAAATATLVVDGRSTDGFLSIGSFASSDEGVGSPPREPSFSPSDYIEVSRGAAVVIGDEPDAVRMLMILDSAIATRLGTQHAADPEAVFDVDPGRYLLSVEALWKEGKLGFGSNGTREEALFFFPIRLVDPDVTDAGEPATASQAQPTIQRSFSVKGVDWTVSTSSSADGPCLTVSGTLRSDPNQAGSVGGCGASSDDGFDWGVGGVSLGGQWYTIVSGRIPLSGHVQVLIRNGAVMSDPREGSGVWVVVFPATTTDREFDVVRIQAWDGSGKLLGTVTPPSISDLRTAYAQLTQASPSAG